MKTVNSELRKIDWDKVPKGVDVQVTDAPQFGWTAFPRQYFGYCDALDKPHVVFLVGFSGDSARIEQWEHCRLAPGVQVKPEWTNGASVQEVSQ
jgi:hypothetical protein